MRILQLIQKKQLRGAETFASLLSNHLIASGHKVKVVALLDGDGILPLNGTIHVLNAQLKKRFWDLAAWKKLAKVIQEFQPDVIQANAGDTLLYASMSKRLYGWKAPIVFRNASITALYLQGFVNIWLYRFLFTQVKAIASVSNASLQSFLQYFPQFAHHIHVLPVGVELQIAAPKQLPQHFTVVHVGGFTYEKNHEGVIRIFEQLLVQIPNARLIMVGAGKLWSTIHDKVKQQNYHSQIQMVGHQQDALAFMNQAHVLILPSIIEGLPGVILEAMYCKTPVIAYDVGGISEVVNETTGYLIPKNDEAAFVDALVAVANQRPEDKIEAAYQLVTTQYDNKSIATQFATMYQQLVAQA
jgi:glycosyltransferase involved in cell wall biosynthesis